MNGQVDLKESLLKARHNLEMTDYLRQEQILKKLPDQNSSDLIDSLPIVIENGMQFSFEPLEDEAPMDARATMINNMPGEINGAWMLSMDGALELPQGKMVSLSGPHGSGKATVLKLLSGIFYPSIGNIYIPSHLRLLHVSHTTQLLERSLWHNLTYGATRLNRKRVMAIVRRLGSESGELAKQLQAEYDNAELCEGDGQAWRDSLCYTEKAVVHIVRALVMNPEVMVLHRPIVHFAHKQQNMFMKLLKEHVDARGLEMGEHPKELRRPRTVVYSTDFPWAANMADVKVVVDVTRASAGGDIPTCATLRILPEEQTSEQYADDHNF